MKNLFKLCFILTYICSMMSCANEDNEINFKNEFDTSRGFDEDGIENTYNGGGVDFSQFSTVLTAITDDPDYIKEPDSAFFHTKWVNFEHKFDDNFTPGETYLVLFSRSEDKCYMTYVTINDTYKNQAYHAGNFYLQKDESGDFLIKLNVIRAADVIFGEGDEKSIEKTAGYTITFKYYMTPDKIALIPID